MKAINRRGTIHFTDESPNQCKDVGHSTIFYEITLEFENDTEWDERGFLLDHNEIDELAQQTIVGSCEEITDQLVAALEERIYGDDRLRRYFIRGSITIKPFGDIDMQYVANVAWFVRTFNAPLFS